MPSSLLDSAPPLPMPGTAPDAGLLRSLGRLVRGLSALFWGLPIALVVCFHTASSDTLRPTGLVPDWAAVIPALAATGLLIYGLWLLGDFQKQERIWRNALDRARVLGLINMGLSPFLYWWKRMPANELFLTMVILMAVFGGVFLASLNQLLQRLGAILPDEALRLEIRQFTVMNLNILAVTVALAALYVALGRIPPPSLPSWLELVMRLTHSPENGGLWFWWFLVLLMLVPLAMTMALIWKTKEVVLDGVFRPGE